MNFKTLIIVIGIMLLIVNCGHTQTVKLQWDDNTEKDLMGYKIHYGLASRNYTTQIDIGDTTSWQGVLEYDRHYYFAVTAYDSTGNESGFSNEVDTMIVMPDTTPPAPPQNLRMVNINITVNIR